MLGALSSSQARADSLSLGAAGNFAVLGLNGATIQLSSGPLVFNGNVGIGDGGSLSFSGGGQINGTIEQDPSATVTLSGGGTAASGGIQNVNFSPIQSAALSEASTAAALTTSTQTFSTIVNPLTINGNGGTNVIGVSGDIHLSGGNLTLNGSANEVFIFNIDGGLQSSGGNTNIVLTGGSDRQ